MKSQYQIAAIQMKSVMKETKHNLDKAIDLIEKAARDGAELICLPELFYQGYHLTQQEFFQTAEYPDGVMYQELAKVAKEKQLHIVAPYAEKTHMPGVIYNSAILVNDQGQLQGNMRKVYLWGEESTKFRAGDHYPVYETPLGKIGIMICYDIEFPEPPRIQALKGAELILAPSVWSLTGEPRWDIDLPAAALYNGLFTMGVNTIDNGACGKSKVVNPKGIVVNEAPKDKETILITDINRKDIYQARADIPYLKDFREDTFSMEAIHRY
ncbi:nitrilase-related carbon-nitrogen hydrolase [Tindallia californiensis]|uniref:Predicted amidohydrolase n=1 Tax=Tindallia californiensis TaxID=159292 RepID=A0A1H3PJA0_9FIRM|nr:nitrilase-related carbon-nitrogen hydrolase [Tindallia californiensis]SDZ00499.1 Predicted amidohydrolase [Tindallia californiensis]